MGLRQVMIGDLLLMLLQTADQTRLVVLQGWVPGVTVVETVILLKMVMLIQVQTLVAAALLIDCHLRLPRLALGIDFKFHDNYVRSQVFMHSCSVGFWSCSL